MATGGVQSFDEWADLAGLNERSKELLKKHDLDDIKALQVIDIDKVTPLLKLSLGQAAIFNDAVQNLKKTKGTGCVPTPQVNNAPDIECNATLDALRQEANIQETVQELQTSGSNLSNLLGSSLTGQLSSHSIKGNDVFDPIYYLRPKTQAKYHDITDFVTVNQAESEEVISCKDDVEMVLRNTSRKPKIALSNVTVSQWNVANYSILYQLLLDGSLSQDQIPDYLAYSIKTLEFLTIYEWQSILLYDREYRKKQATYSFRWGLDPSHMIRATLIPKHSLLKKGIGQQQKTKNVSSKTARGPYVPKESEICLSFNSRAGCRWGDVCKYQHVCSESGCGQNHPRYQHQKS